MGRNLFNESSEEEDNKSELKTNKEYAKHYNVFRQKELFKKLKDREKNESGSDLSSDSEPSDEDEAIDPEFNEKFLATLASLKSKDPKIYDKTTKFFEDSNEENEVKSKSTKKPFTLKDYERKVILEKGGVYEDDESENETTIPRSQSPTLIEKQNLLKEELKQIVNKDDDSDEEFGGIFKKREKSKEEKDKEEKDYLKWLAGEQQEIAEETKITLNPLKQYWNKPDLPKPEKFLRDYILNNGYVDKDESEIPTYEEIVGDENLSEDEKELEKQEEFEHKYNFRFEEPDQEFIKRYPRTIEQSVRQKDEKRKQKREEVKERKQREKEQKFQELQMLKEFKRKEIEEKIQKLKEVTGNEQLPFADDDLDEDFDPEAHDRKMNEIFNDHYYEVDEGEEKPECPDIEELKTEDWDNYDPENDDCYDYEAHCEDDDFNMDCDFDPNSKETFQQDLIENTKDKRKSRKRRNRFMELIKKEKPPFNPEDEKTYAEYIDEYYKLDCEDIIGDTPCRFKYVETVPNDFGLTTEEILLAKNKELNQWASLKKAVQIRPEQVEKRDARIYKLKGRNEELKRKIFVSLYGAPSEDEDTNIEATSVNIHDSSTTVSKKKKKKKRSKSAKKVNNLSSNERNDIEAKNNKDLVSSKEKQTNKEDKETKNKRNKINSESADAEINANLIPIDKMKDNDSQVTSEAIVIIKNAENHIKGNKKANHNTEPNPTGQKRKKTKSISENVDEKISKKIPKLEDTSFANGAGKSKNMAKQDNIFNKQKNKKLQNKSNPATKKGFKKTSKKRNQSSEDNPGLQLSDARLKAYGLNPNKFRWQQKNTKQQQKKGFKIKKKT